ncbi:radical SAM family heme chaperone HemW [Niabella drilacis]|uniref:Heme chaperone HemW n=1 Tax=Niabella drilacis (strain DSM 25811 / CCM 8410 / CCUG 62505 / LMG 26954 / E90) TaxID=1285928 RepID=A0A1G6Z914_NIADE|nr:radical SAM family heme chaperone HemW [Niabella drilacis]SDD99080.1 oxygen-independent coproporphyrinogen-3 oxidase [Niabella drilacis]
MSGIYIHIPFCRQACHYCNFHFSTSLHYREALVETLREEIMLAAATGFIKPEPVATVYFGGGTPSLLPAAEIGLLLKQVRESFPVTGDAEITLEANPDDLTPGKLADWRTAGVNRLSIGVQSFFEEDLQWMNRAHNAVQAREGLELAMRYFDNITMDLIYGTPGLSNERWAQNVATALKLGVPHLSCYALTVEPQTPLDKMIRTHRAADVDADLQSTQFLLLMDWLQEAGYEHYEISNFARPGFRSRHNSAYWKGTPYYGLGPAAHSFNGKARRWNVANNQKYIRAIRSGEIPFEEEVLTTVQKLNEYIMIALRTSEGILLQQLDETTRQRVLQQAADYQVRGWLSIDTRSIRLTRQGKLFADGIAADLFLTE